jgi:16S rRNA (cytosine1407-C5)-methyltransferase
MRKDTRHNYKKPRKRPVEKRKFYTKENIFISRLASILKMPKWKIKPLFSQRAITTIRLNSLKGDPKKTKKLLEKRGYELEPVKWAKDVYFVLNKDKKEVSKIREYEDGLFYIQNLSSILAALVLEPEQNDKVLDMCAAPGSKTTHIAQLTNNKAEIVANDSEVQRLGSLQNVLYQFGARSAKTALNDGEVFGSKYPNMFDKILLDAPCSGEGMIYFPGEKPLRFWSIKKIKASAYTQRKLIESAFKSLKPGGTLVYSTCTLEPEENEGVVTHLLNSFTNAKLEDINIDVNAEQGIQRWSGNSYHRDIDKTIRILPSPEMMGFYIAKIKKVS